MVNTRKITEIYEMEVFTDSGEYFGDVEESILADNKVFGWKVRATKRSYLSKMLGGAKGVIVPHQLVKSCTGDVMIISKTAIQNYDSEEKEA